MIRMYLQRQGADTICPFFGVGNDPYQQDCFNGIEMVNFLRVDEKPGTRQSYDEFGKGPGHCFPVVGDENPSLGSRKDENRWIA
jgi:hypothetical protein